MGTPPPDDLPRHICPNCSAEGLCGILVSSIAPEPHVCGKCGDRWYSEPHKST